MGRRPQPERLQKQEHNQEKEMMLLMVELLTSIATLGIILIGIAILLQVTSIEDLLSLIGRAVAVLVLVVLALCILKYLWICAMVPWLSAAFESLLTLIGWLLVTIVGLIALSLVSRAVLRRFGRHLTLRRDPQTGDVYDNNDSKDAKN
jgi:uncharacterized BrkB/YihY/UPF0761 family membrane protein